MSDQARELPANEQALAGEVNQEASRLLEALLRYKNVIIGVALALIIAAAAYTGVTLWSSHSVSTAQEELGKILLTTDGADRIDALTDFAANAPEGVRNSALFELADAQMRAGQYETATATWDQLAGRIQSLELGIVAQMGKARSQLLSGQAEQAQQTVAAIQSQAPDSFQGPLNRLLATAAEQAGDTQTALDAYQALLSGGQAADAPFLQYKIQQLQAQ